MATGDLVTVARVREQLGDEVADKSDSEIETLITAATREIEGYCRLPRNTFFTSTSYVHVLDGNGSRPLVLKRTPVTEIERVATTRQTALRIQASGAQDASVEIETDTPQLELRRMVSGVKSTDNVVFSSNVTVDAVGTAVNAVSNWTATVESPYGEWPSDWLHPLNRHLPATEEDACLYLFGEQEVYEADTEAGLLYGRFPVGRDTVEVRYTAGFSTIPEDLQQATVDLIQSMVSDTGDLIEQKLGDHAEKYRTDGTAGIPRSVRSSISKYRDLALHHGGMG